MIDSIQKLTPVGCQYSHPTCTDCAELESCPLMAAKLGKIQCSGTIHELFTQSSEGLIILIRNGELALYHKFKSRGSTLHHYLAELLTELNLKVYDESSPPNSD